jgi:hypothetical protein
MKSILGWSCVAVAGLFLASGAFAQDAPGVIHVFNGKDLGGFYKFIKDRGRDQDPKNVFTVQDGMLRISGEEWGCVTSVNEFENYRLIVEFKWGELTHANRKEAARDSGVLVHSNGADGGYGGIWMHSIECQLIEGGTGDILVVGDDSDQFSVTSPVAPELSGGCVVYQPGGKPATLHKGRVNWFGRDPEWKDLKGFRGKQDVEKPVGEWNRYECIADGDKITLLLNGVTVNGGFDVKPHKGRIQIQSEGAEIFVRRVDVIPLAPTAAKDASKP